MAKYQYNLRGMFSLFCNNLGRVCLELFLVKSWHLQYVGALNYTAVYYWSDVYIYEYIRGTINSKTGKIKIQGNIKTCLICT